MLKSHVLVYCLPHILYLAREADKDSHAIFATIQNSSFNMIMIINKKVSLTLAYAYVVFLIYLLRYLLDAQQRQMLRVAFVCHSFFPAMEIHSYAFCDYVQILSILYPQQAAHVQSIRIAQVLTLNCITTLSVICQTRLTVPPPLRTLGALFSGQTSVYTSCVLYRLLSTTKCYRLMQCLHNNLLE